MFYVIYHKKGEPGYHKEDGFRSREKAWKWLESFIDEVDYYEIKSRIE